MSEHLNHILTQTQTVHFTALVTHSINTAFSGDVTTVSVTSKLTELIYWLFNNGFLCTFLYRFFFLLSYRKRLHKSQLMMWREHAYACLRSDHISIPSLRLQLCSKHLCILGAKLHIKSRETQQGGGRLCICVCLYKCVYSMCVRTPLHGSTLLWSPHYKVD